MYILESSLHHASAQQQASQQQSHDLTYAMQESYYQEQVPTVGDDLTRLEQECEDAWLKKEDLVQTLQEARLMAGGEMDQELSGRLRVRWVTHLSCVI